MSVLAPLLHHVPDEQEQLASSGVPARVAALHDLPGFPQGLHEAPAGGGGEARPPHALGEVMFDGLDLYDFANCDRASGSCAPFLVSRAPTSH